MLYDGEHPDIPTSELWKLQFRRSDMAKKYLDAWNRSAEMTKSKRSIDAIISPVSPYPAVLHGNFDGVSYSSVWNVLGISLSW